MQKSLLSEIYIAYALGLNANNKLEYENPKIINAQKTDVKSLVAREDIGYVPEYDRLLLVPYGEESQFINAETKLWIDIEPNESASNPDYTIERVGDIIDNCFILYCNSTSSNTKPLYYLNEKNNTIYQVKLDLDNLVAMLPFNKWLPITETTKVWLTKPIDNDTTKNLIRMVSKEKLSKSYKLTFEKVI